MSAWLSGCEAYRYFISRYSLRLRCCYYALFLSVLRFVTVLRRVCFCFAFSTTMFRCLRCFGYQARELSASIMCGSFSVRFLTQMKTDVNEHGTNVFILFVTTYVWDRKWYLESWYFLHYFTLNLINSISDSNSTINKCCLTFFYQIFRRFYDFWFQFDNHNDIKMWWYQIVHRFMLVSTVLKIFLYTTKIIVIFYVKLDRQVYELLKIHGNRMQK